jgi:hypothetical protein
MKLHIRGNTSKLSKAQVMAACNFYAENLLSTRMLKNLTVTVKFDGDIDVKGLTEFIDCNISPREFVISINPSQSKRNHLMTLAHEFVHVKQYVKGEMKQYLSKPAVKWYKQTIFYEDAEYWDLPWEIEAYGREVGLYYKFLKSFQKSS